MDSAKESVRKLNEIRLAFKKDLEELIEKYENLKTYKFEEFVKIWTDLRFSLIFKGMNNCEEILLQTQVFLFESKKYFIFAKNLFQKTAALYALYSLYYLQPLKTTIKIRIVRSDMKSVNEYLEKTESQTEAEDARFVYAKLLYEDAFDLVHSETNSQRKDYRAAFEWTDDTFRADVAAAVEARLRDVVANDGVRAVREAYARELREYLEETDDTDFMSFDHDVQGALGEIFGIAGRPEEAEENDELGRRRKDLKRKAFRTSRSS